MTCKPFTSKLSLFSWHFGQTIEDKSYSKVKCTLVLLNTLILSLYDDNRILFSDYIIKDLK